MSVLVQPSGGIQHETLLSQPTVQLFDSGGNLVNGSSQIVTVEAVPAQAILGTVRMTVTTGRAHFTDLVLTAPGTIQLKFAIDGGLVSVSSRDVEVQPGFENLLVSCPYSSQSGPNAVINTNTAGSQLLGQNCTEPAGVDDWMPHPVVQLLGPGNIYINNTHLPVTVSLQASNGANLYGSITDRTCCRRESCQYLFPEQCCDCNDPACALCVIADGGEAVFEGMYIDKVGTYSLTYKVQQFAMFDGSTMTTRESVVTENSKWNIVSGTPDSLAIVEQPSENYIQGLQGDEPGLFNPQPRLVFSDSEGNPAESTAAGRVIATGCYTGADRFADVVEGFCLCTDTDCLLQDTVAKLQDKAALSLGGTVREPFVGGIARYTDLSITLARQDLRLAFHRLGNDGPLGTYVLSTVFRVSAGRLDHMSIEDEPALQRGCARCPPGLHLAKGDLRAVLKMRDKFDNLISECGSISPFCQGVGTGTVQTSLMLDGVDVTDTHLSYGPGQFSSVLAVAGTANFTALRPKVSGNVYTLKFTAQGYIFSEILADTPVDIVATSQPFHVVSGSPILLNSLNAQVIQSTDLEVVPVDVSVDARDSASNVALSDCYTTCSGTLVGLCTNSSTGCNLEVNIRVSSGNARLIGSTTGSIVQGAASFPGLVLQSLVEVGECTSTEFERLVLLNVSVAGLPEMVQKVQLERSVEKIDILIQPSGVVARERFISPPTVRVLDCAGTLVRHATASIRVAIKSNAGGGKLSGTLTVPLVNGTASFGDMSIDLFSNGYTLEFTYVGNAIVPAVTTDAFTVEPPVARMAITSGPQSSNTVAGVPFATQPVLDLQNLEGATVDSNAFVTASIKSNPGNLQAHDPGQARLLGTTVVQAVRGTVTFTDLFINKASLGQGLSSTSYTLNFLLYDFSVDSGAFTITPAAWSGIYIAPADMPGPPGRGTAIESVAGNPFKRQPTVLMVDVYKNIVLESQIPATIPGQGLAIPVVDVTLLTSRAEAILQRECDDTPEVCVGARPVVCSTCTNMRRPIQKSVAIFSGLRIDIASGISDDGYRLNFTATGFGFSVVSEPFFVQNTVPDYPFILNFDEIQPTTFADEDIPVQPKVTVRDRFGNPVVFDDIPDRRVKVKVLYAGGLPPVPPGLPPVPGQKEGSVCTLWDGTLEGNLDVPVDLETGQGVFTNLAVRQVMSDYRLEFEMRTSVGTLFANSSAFRVLPGRAVGICPMSKLGLCSDLGQCRESASMACVDPYGNVQPSCQTCFTHGCGDSPLVWPTGMFVPCAGGVCVKLLQGPPDALLASATGGVGGSTDCSRQFCTVSLANNGVATFTDLTFSKFGTTYVIEFKAYVVDSYTEVIHEWVHVTEPFTVYPAAPRILTVAFTPSMGQLVVDFDRDTSMNAGGLTPDTSCEELHPDLLRAIGADPMCVWTLPSRLLISIGDGSTTSSATPIKLADDSRITASAYFEGPPATTLESFPATTQIGLIVNDYQIVELLPAYPPSLPVPLPEFYAPAKLNACTRLRADGAYSLGNAGRPFIDTEWSMDLDRSFSYRGLLESRDLAPRWYKNRIHFSSLLPGSLNTVTVTLRPSAPILPRTNITISGLPRYTRPSTECPHVPFQNDNVGKCFGRPLDRCRSIPLTGPGSKRFSGDFVTNFGGAVIQFFDDDVPPEINHLIFQVSPYSFVPEYEDTVISFQFQNPAGLFEGGVVSFAGVCQDCICVDAACETKDTYGFDELSFESDCGRLCDSQTAIYSIEDVELTAKDGTITETTRVNGALNVLTVSFTPSSPLPPRARITIAGLGASAPKNGKHCVSGPGAVVFRCGDCGGSAGHGGEWTDAGLVLTVRNDSMIDTSSPTTFSFEIFNPPAVMRTACGAQGGNACPSAVNPVLQITYVEGSSFASPMSQLIGDVLGAGDSSAITEASVAESNDVQSTTNLVTLSFTANRVLPAGTQVTFKGFNGANYTSRTSLSLYSTPSAMLDGVPLASCFTDDSGTPSRGSFAVPGYFLALKVAAGCKIGAGYRVVLAVALRNPPAAMPQQGSISVEAANNGCPGCFAACTCSPLSVPGFSIPNVVMQGAIFKASTPLKVTRGEVSEDNPVASQLNNLTVSIFSPLDLMPGTVVSVTGLTGLETPSPYLIPITLADGSTHPSVQSTGDWDQSMGKVTFSLSGKVSKGTVLAVSFELRNGASASTGVAAVSMDARVNVCDVDAVACPAQGLIDVVRFQAFTLTGAAVLRNGMPAMLKSKVIRQSSRGMGAYNILVVRLTPNFDLMEGAKITISKLKGSQTPSVTQITTVSDLSQILFNCSCAPAPIEGSACGTCPQSSLAAISGQFRVWQPNVDSNGWTYFGKPRLSDGQPATDLTDSGGMRGSWENDASTCGLDCGRLVVEVTRPGDRFPAGRELIFGFVLVNSGVATTAVTPQVAVNDGGSIVIPKEDMDGSVLGAGSNPVIVAADMLASTEVTGDYVNLTLIIRPNSPLVSIGSPGVLITVSGLANFEEPTGWVSISGSNAHQVSKGAVGYWDKTLGTLVLSGGSLLGGCDTIIAGPSGCALPSKPPYNVDTQHLSSVSFSFSLKRPLKMDAAPVLPSISAAAASTIMPARKVSGNALDMVGSGPASIQSASIVQMSATRGAMNLLVVTLMANLRMYPTSKITVSGLKGSPTPDGTLVVSSEGDKFSTSAMWNQSTGSVVATVGATIPSFTNTSFSFQIVNPLAKQAPPPLSIKLTVFGPGQNGATSAVALETEAYALRGGPGGVGVPGMILAAEVGASFAVRSIGESTRVDHAINTLTATLHANVPLPIGSLITLSGLKSASSSGDIPLYNTHSSYFANGKGTFSADTVFPKIPRANPIDHAVFAIAF